jgi:hypothetical protein
MTTRLSRDGRHATVLLGATGATGQVGLFDVGDGHAMLQALDAVRRSRTASDT